MFSFDPTKLNERQLRIAMVVSRIKDEEELNALSYLIARFFSERMNKEMERLQAEGVITPEKIASWRTEHNRTPYWPARERLDVPAHVLRYQSFAYTLRTSTGLPSYGEPSA